MQMDFMKDILEQILHVNLTPPQFVQFVRGLLLLYESMGVKPESVEQFNASNSQTAIHAQFAGLQTIGVNVPSSAASSAQ